jgi:hypothetical protein
MARWRSAIGSGWQCRPHKVGRHDTVFLTHLRTLQSYAPSHMNSRGQTTDGINGKYIEPSPAYRRETAGVGVFSLYRAMAMHQTSVRRCMDRTFTLNLCTAENSNVWRRRRTSGVLRHGQRTSVICQVR